MTDDDTEGCVFYVIGKKRKCMLVRLSILQMIAHAFARDGDLLANYRDEPFGNEQ